MQAWIPAFIVLVFIALMAGGVDHIAMKITANAWARFAAQHGLVFEHGLFRWFGNSTPHKVRGMHDGRTVEGYQSLDGFLNPISLSAWTSYLRVSISSRPDASVAFSHNWWWMFSRTKSYVGDPIFDRFVRVDSKPKRYATKLLESGEIRRLVKALVSPTIGPVSDLRITPAGSLYLFAGIAPSERVLSRRLNLLRAIAEALERLY